MVLQKSDLIFGTYSDVLRPPHNFEPYYRVIILTTEVWTREGGTPPALKRLVRYTYVSRTPVGGCTAGVYWQYLVREFGSSIRSLATIFQADIFAILPCDYENQMIARP